LDLQEAHPEDANDEKLLAGIDLQLADNSYRQAQDDDVEDQVDGGKRCDKSTVVDRITLSECPPIRYRPGGESLDLQGG
jgi:hypothetical protein